MQGNESIVAIRSLIRFGKRTKRHKLNNQNIRIVTWNNICFLISWV